MPAPAAPPYVSPRSRASFAVILFGLTIGLGVAGMIAAIMDRALFSKAIATPGLVSDERLVLSDTIATVLGLAQFATFVVTVVVFLTWFHRVSANLPQLGVHPRYSPAWSVGMWFVPIANLFLPKRATNDAWRAGTDQPVPAWIHLWWAVWLVSNLLGRVVFRRYLDAETLEEYRTAATVELWSYTIDIVAAALAIGVVVSITRRQEERAEGGLPGPPEPEQWRPPVVTGDEEFTIEPGWKRTPEPT